MYTPRPEDVKRIENDFTYHAPKPEREQGERYDMVRNYARCCALKLLELCPPSRELSLALTHLEEAMFYANAAIARNE